MRFFLPVFGNGNHGPVSEKEENAKAFVPYNYYRGGSYEVTVWSFLGRDLKSVSNYLYDSTFLRMLKELPNKLMVVPPLLDIRSNSKTFPPARRVAYCALKGLSLYGNPFSVAPESEEEYYEEE